MTMNTELENRLNSLLTENVRLEKLAYIDRLTGCYNQNYLYEKYYYDFLKDPSDLIIYYIDLDNLKQINDTKGHNLGDKYLQIFANGMRNLGDLFRVGGDEFILIANREIDNINILSDLYLFSYGKEYMCESDFEEVLIRAERKMMKQKHLKKR